MNFASIELCKELSALTKWSFPLNQGPFYCIDSEGRCTVFAGFGPLRNARLENQTMFPAYDLGYLLRKLPSFYFPYKGKSGRRWYMGEITGSSRMPTCRVFDETESKTPEDAAIKLVTSLIKQGVLTK